MEHFNSGQQLRILRIVPHYGDDPPPPLQPGDIVQFVMKQKSPGVGHVYSVRHGDAKHFLVREDFECVEWAVLL